MLLIYRNYYAMQKKPLMTSTGIPTSAIFGCASFLLNLMNDDSPDYFAIAIDSKGGTFRNEASAEYKANRKPMPEDLQKQIPYFYKLCLALDIPLIKIKGQEADDIIGTLVTRFSSPEVKCFIISNDKDLMQLVSDTVCLYNPKSMGRAEIINRTAVINKMEVAPENIVDLLALMGDSSDNIMGVKGIGKKGATNLIKRFGSVENIYDNLSSVTGRQQDLLREGRDSAFLSKELATINKNIPLDCDIETFRFEHRDWRASKELLSLFEELEFNKLRSI